MALRRACSYKATIKLPKAASEYSKILVTFQQEKRNLINLDQTEITVDTEEPRQIIVELDQTQTKMFSDAAPAFLQVRAYASQYEAPGSKVWTIPVYPALNDEVLE